MHRSFPITLVLAALATLGVCGAASAAMNNPNPSTPVLTTTIKTKPKLPAGPATPTSLPMEKTNAKATSTSASANATAPQSTAPNSSAAAPGSKPVNQSGLPPVVQLRQDMNKEQQLINKNKNYITEMQLLEADPMPYNLGKFDRLWFGCNSGVCSRIFNAYVPGRPPIAITLRVDLKGNMLPGEIFRLVHARNVEFDKVIAEDTQLIAAARKRIAADSSALRQNSDSQD